MGQLQWHDAILDLKRALTMCADGDAQKELIATKLAVAKAHQPCDESTDLSDTDSVRNAERDGGVVIEEVTDAPASNPSPLASASGGAAAAAAAATGPTGLPGGVSAAQAEQMARMLANDPAQVNNMVQAVDSMSDADFDRMVRQSGVPGMDRATMQQVRLPLC